MNKFGIFSLLNSFLNSYVNNANKKESDTTEKNENIFNTFSKLFSNEKPKETLEKEKKQELTPPPAHKPLQKDMLNVVVNHDEIVKRILEKNKK